MPGFTPEKMVGPTKLPCSKPATVGPRPSSSRVAPSASPRAMKPVTRSCAAQEITGPTSTPCSVPAPILSVLALATSSGIHCRASPTSTATETAMQRWPAAPKAAPARALSVCSLWASGITIAWFLAPIMHCTRLPAAMPRW